MAWIEANALFNPDDLHNRVIGVCSALGQHDSGSHLHRMGQLLFTRQGCVRLTLNNGALLCLLPMYDIRKAPSLAKYRGRLDNLFVTAIGLLSILNIVYKLF